MNIEIDDITVTITGEALDEDAIVREIQWHLGRALEMFSQDDLLLELDKSILDELELPPIDWDVEVDKTGKLTQLLINAIEDYVDNGR